MVPDIIRYAAVAMPQITGDDISRLNSGKAENGTSPALRLPIGYWILLNYNRQMHLGYSTEIIPFMDNADANR